MNVVEAINAIKESKRCLFMLAIMSGNPRAAQYVYREIIDVYYEQPSEVIKGSSTSRWISNNISLCLL